MVDMAKIILSYVVLSIFGIGNVHSTDSLCRPIRRDFASTQKIVYLEPASLKYHFVSASGNDIFLTTFNDGGRKVYSYDLAGTQKFVKQIPDGRAFIMDVHDGILYVTNTKDTVYTMPVSGDEAFTEHNVGNISPSLIAISDDGERIAVARGLSSPKVINIYDKNFQLIKSIGTGHKYIFDIDFDKDGNLYVTTNAGSVLIFGKDYTTKQSVCVKGGSSQLSSVYVHCDGTVILGDFDNGLIVTENVDLYVLPWYDVPNISMIQDITMTTDGTLVVTAGFTNKVYLFSAY